MKFAPRLAAALASGLATALLATGCGADNPKPAPLPSGSPTASATASAFTPVPAAAKKKTPAGAKAFVAHFLVAMSEAGDSGDTREFRSLFTETCGSCLEIANGIDRIYRKGGMIQGGEWRITSTKTYGFDGPRFPVDIIVSSAKQNYRLKSGGTLIEAKPQHRVSHYLDVTWQRDQWVVTGMDESA